MCWRGRNCSRFLWEQICGWAPFFLPSFSLDSWAPTRASSNTLPQFSIPLQLCPIQFISFGRHPSKVASALPHLTGNTGWGQRPSKGTPALRQREDNHTYPYTHKSHRLAGLGGSKRRSLVHLQGSQRLTADS